MHLTVGAFGAVEAYFLYLSFGLPHNPNTCLDAPSTRLCLCQVTNLASVQQRVSSLRLLTSKP